MDGTLIDSMGVWDTLADDILRSFGVEPPPDACAKFRVMTTPEAAAYLAECGVPGTVGELTDHINGRVEDFYRSRVLPKPGARAYLDALSQRGVKMYVATANERHITQAALKRCCLFDYFDGIITCTEAGMTKTDPGFFTYCLGVLGTAAEETWVYEDMTHAVVAARAAGLKTVGVYDPVSAKYCPELRSEADRYILSYENEGV